jgi:hypothetical protein
MNFFPLIVIRKWGIVLRSHTKLNMFCIDISWKLKTVNGVVFCLDKYNFYAFQNVKLDTCDSKTKLHWQRRSRLNLRKLLTFGAESLSSCLLTTLRLKCTKLGFSTSWRVHNNQARMEQCLIYADVNSCDNRCDEEKHRFYYILVSSSV